MSDSVFLSRRYMAVSVATVVAVAVTWWQCSRATRYYTDEGVVWTTGYHVVYEAHAPLGDSIQAVFAACDASASAYSPVSLLTRLNDNTTDSVDDIITRLHECAVAVNASSDGLYDPTVRPLVRLWGFGDDGAAVSPTREVLDSVLDFVGLDKTSIVNGRLLKADPRVQLDFSSIAKGLACDMVANMLSRNGVRNYMVEIGGEVVCAGTSNHGTPWRVSIDAPVVSDSVRHVSLVNVVASGHAVATSGNYRQWRDDGTRRVSHIINPVTGDAVVGDLVSVTVIADDCMTADAWSTACMAMGDERVRRDFVGHGSLGVMTVKVDSLGRFVAWSNSRFADLVEQ